VPEIRLHDLMHTHATVLQGRSEPVHVVSQWRGHASVVVTLTVYAHVLPATSGGRPAGSPSWWRWRDAPKCQTSITGPG
jgi:integrase